jgi:hypothetical protein
LLGALDHPDPERAVARERIRARQALASLSRLALGPAPIETLRAAIEEFAARETPAIEARPPAAAPDREGMRRRPRRRQRAPLDFQRHLLEGYAGLTAAERERWRQLDAGAAGPAPILDLAWFACDGRRTLDEIVRLVWIECGRHAPREIAEFFDGTERLGLSDGSGSEEAAWSSSARGTATP